MPLLSLQAVSLRIQDQEILRDVTLNVDEGEVIGLIGPNGSGKTTLFNVISGFIKPTAGSITLHGENITAVSPAKRAQRGLGRVFQNFGIFRDMTWKEKVRVAREALPRDSRRALGNLKKVTEETLEMVGLASQGKKKAGALSGGQMRLLEIARTLRSGKELFLLDEPTAGVSPKMTKAVSDLITKLKTARKTVIVIEHDLPFISRICDRVAVMDVGEIVLHGTPETVKQSKKLQDIYFGADPAQ